MNESKSNAELTSVFQFNEGKGCEQKQERERERGRERQKERVRKRKKNMKAQANKLDQNGENYEAKKGFTMNINASLRYLNSSYRHQSATSSLALPSF